MNRSSALLLLFLAPFLGRAAAHPGSAGSDGPGRADHGETRQDGGRVEGISAGIGGKPLGGAVVILRYATRLQPEYLRQEVGVSGPDGRFRFAGLPADAQDARVAAYVPGMSLATPSEGEMADPSPGSAPLRLVLEPRSVLRIRFRVPEGLPPAEGAVALDRSGGWIPFAASEAVLAGLPEGKVGIKYHSEAYGGGVIFADLGPDRRLDTAVELARPDWVEGRLLDERGSPLAGALYRPENAFRGMAARTGEDGVFRIRRARAGVRQVQFRDPRFRDTTVELGREAGRRPLEVRLDPGAAPIAGRVAPPAGRPGACLATAAPAEPRKAASARVRWPGSEARRAIPGPDGAFLLRGLAAETYRIRVECPGANLAEALADPGARLPPMAPGAARALEARVAVRGSGGPVPFPAFRAFGAGPESPEAALLDAPGRGDSLGRFTVFPRFEGFNHLCASAPGFAPACRLLAPGDTLPATLELEPAHALTVRVLAADSARPLPGARVRVRKAGSRDFAWAGETDAGGVFTAGGLGRGEYQVDVREGGRIPFREALDVPGDSLIEARLEPGAVLEGTLSAEGRLPPGLRVLARPAWPAGPRCPETVAEAPVRADGAFRLAGLGDCPVTLGVAAAWSRRTPFLPLWRMDGARPGRGPLEIRLPRTRAWEITVVSGGLPLPGGAGIHILVPPPQGGGEALGHPLGRIAVRGPYSLNAFVGARYIAVAGAPGYLERADTVVIPPGDEPFETRLELPAWPGLKGRIARGVPAAGVPADNAPAGVAPGPSRGGHAGWTVRGPRGAAAEVQEDGAFQIAGLPPGPASLDVRDGAGRLVWSGFGMAGGGETAIAPADSLETVEGVAVDAEDRPLAGVAVVLRRRESREESGRAHSDGLGRFRLDVPPGAWLACPEDSALACTRLRTGGGAAPARAARVRMAARTRMVRASFLPPLALPLRGGTALAGPGGIIPAAEPQGAMLRAEAAFFRVPEGGHVLMAAAYAPAPAAQWWVSEPWEKGPLRAGIPGPGVSLAAADKDGNPLSGVTVRFLPRAGPSLRPGREDGRPWGEADRWIAPPGSSGGTDAAGTLLCLGVHPGRYWVYASHATHACAPVAWDLPRSGAGRLALVMGRGCPVRVKATFAGNPVAGARVEIFDSLGNRAAPAASAPRDGEPIECGSFAPGRYRVAAAAPGLGRSLQGLTLAEGGEANLEAALPAAGWLELLGEGLEDKSFYLVDRNRQVTLLEREPEAAPLDTAGTPGGSLLFRGVPPDRYEVWMQGGRKLLGEVEIGAARLTVLEVGRIGKAQVAMPARRG